MKGVITMNPMNLFGNKGINENPSRIADIKDFTGSKLLGRSIIIGMHNQMIMTIENSYLLFSMNKETYKIKTDSILFSNIMSALSGLPLVTPFAYLTVKGDKVFVEDEGLATSEAMTLRNNMFNEYYGRCELIPPDTLTKFINNKEFKQFSVKPKEKLVAIPIWNKHAVILDTKGIAIWFGGQVSIAVKGDKLYKGIADIISCMEVSSKFVFIKVTPESAMLTASPEITEEMREFRENLTFGEYGKYELKELIKLRCEE